MKPTVRQALILRGASCAPVILALLLGGCASPVYTEGDLGETREVELDSVFTISLPMLQEWSTPQLKGTIVHFIDQRGEVDDGRVLFRFRAEHEGEIGILIPARQAPGPDRDFSMQVRVVDSSWGDDGESVFEKDWWLDGRSSRDR